MIEFYHVTEKGTKKMSETYYIKAASKAAINRALKAGGNVCGSTFSPWGDRLCSVVDMPQGAVIKVFSKTIGGQPYAKAYGTVHHAKDGTTKIK